MLAAMLRGRRWPMRCAKPGVLPGMTVATCARRGEGLRGARDAWLGLTNADTEEERTACVTSPPVSTPSSAFCHIPPDLVVTGVAAH
jgi:hypothetical protein